MRSWSAPHILLRQEKSKSRLPDLCQRWKELCGCVSRMHRQHRKWKKFSLPKLKETRKGYSTASFAKTKHTIAGLKRLPTVLLKNFHFRQTPSTFLTFEFSMHKTMSSPPTLTLLRLLRENIVSSVRFSLRTYAW